MLRYIILYYYIIFKKVMAQEVYLVMIALADYQTVRYTAYILLKETFIVEISK